VAFIAGCVGIARGDVGGRRRVVGESSSTTEFRTRTDGYTPAVPGPVALVGAGEFLPVMADLDRDLLEATGRSRPRVAIIPTAAWPDGSEVFERWAEMGVAHFRALGAEVEPVLLRGRAEASDSSHVQAIGEADLVYLSGGNPRHLLDALDGTPAGEAVRHAHARGAVVAGCSAGAMVLAGRQADVWKRMLPFPIRWRQALGLVDGVAVLPHYDAWPEALAAAIALQGSVSGVVLGIDGGTAAVGRDGAYQVHGRGRVTVWRGRHRERYRRGETFRVAGDLPSVAPVSRG